MNVPVVNHDPRSFEITSETLSKATLSLRVVYEYKGNNVAYMGASVEVYTPPDFKQMTYRQVKEIFTDSLQRYLFTDAYIASGEVLVQNEPHFKKAYGLTFMEAKAAGDLSVRIIEFRIDRVAELLVLKKKEA